MTGEGLDRDDYSPGGPRRLGGLSVLSTDSEQDELVWE